MGCRRSTTAPFICWRPTSQLPPRVRLLLCHRHTPVNPCMKPLFLAQCDSTSTTTVEPSNMLMLTSPHPVHPSGHHDVHRCPPPWPRRHHQPKMATLLRCVVVNFNMYSTQHKLEHKRRKAILFWMNLIPSCFRPRPNLRPCCHVDRARRGDFCIVCPEVRSTSQDW